MADASDSKSDVGDYVRVQVPPSAFCLTMRKEETKKHYYHACMSNSAFSSIFDECRQVQ